MSQLLFINGPNLNLLGTREPGVYGSTGLAEIESQVRECAAGDGHGIEFFHSNAEHELVERVQAAAADGTEFIVINPAAYTHTSIALRDALLAVAIPFIELHLSNVSAREPFRHRSYLADVAVATLSGFGAYGYQLAYRGAVHWLAARAAG